MMNIKTFDIHHPSFYLSTKLIDTLRLSIGDSDHRRSGNQSLVGDTIIAIKNINHVLQQNV